jgi:uncharacterized membrane protein YjgN (DUF898 family)
MNDTATPWPPPPPDLSVRREPFTFTGTAREYFGIWIVNVLLTILTLGIYSAWAKVRRQRYFYGNTHLAGASFDYHARPLRILVGRIIVLSLLGLYNVTLNISPPAGIAVAVVLVFVIPWLITRGLRFSARVTSYRNVRFDFTGGYCGAFLAYIVGVLVIYASAGVLAPIASRWMWTYTLGNLRYGDRPIDCDPRLEKLYGQWWLPAVVLVAGLLLLVGIAVAIAVPAMSGDGDGLFGGDTLSAVVIVVLIYAALIPFIGLYLVAGLIYRAGTRNVAFNETVIDGRHVLSSSIGRRRYVWISISNLAATVFTFGLARPWAAIRMARYMASVTALDTTGALDRYFASIKTEGAAVGSEFMDVEGFDVGF